MLVGFVFAALLVVAFRLRRWRRSGEPKGRQTSIQSSIQQLKAIGQLSVFRLKDAAKKAAESQAESMILGLCPDVEQSAKKTLRSLARAFGAGNVRFEFPHVEQKSPRPDTTGAPE